MAFQIRNLHPEEFQLVRNWANQIQWNQGRYDYLAFQQLDKEGFWMGVLNGQPISTISAVQYDQNFAFIGLYITKPQYQGKGFGSQVWRKALSRITAKVVGLQGVQEQQGHYMKIGFKTYHNTITHKMNGTNKQFISKNLIDCKLVDFEKLSAYDRQNFPADRKEFLRKWISLPESKGMAFMKDGKIEGYGVLRRSDNGVSVGPLCSDSYQVAQQIFEYLAGLVPKEEKVLLDLSDINPNALKLAQNFKMQPGFTCARMYTHQCSNILFNRTVYGFASIQLG